MGVAERGGVLARRNEPSEMRHVDEQQRTNLIANRAEAGEVEMARVGRAAGDDHLRAMFLREAFDLVEIDQMVVAPDAVLDGIEPFARLRRRSAVGQVTTRGKTQAHDRVAGL